MVSKQGWWVGLWLAVWVMGLILVPGAAAQESNPPQLTVLTGALNVRSGPGVNYPAVSLLARGDRVALIGHHAASGWWQAQLADGSTGWVSGGAAYVSVSGDTEDLSEASATLPASAGVQSTSSSASPPGAQTSRTIVFQSASGGAIYAVDADGSNLRYLTSGMDPALSPDGRWVAFTRWNDTQGGALGSLWVIHVDGTGERVVLGDIHQPKSPTWSPDGTHIAISMQHGGRPTEERRCSSEPPPRGAYDVDVNRDEEGDIEFCFTLSPHPYWGLRMVDVASGDFEDLPNDLFSYSPAWDPANAWRLVYDGERGLRSLDLNQGTSWALTNDANDHSPVFSPDGSQIAVSYWQHDHWEIHALNADTLTGTGGTGRVRLTETPLRVRLEQMVNGEMPQSWNNAAPTWSPDGSQIAFLSDRSGEWAIWIMNADGSNQHPLLPEGAQTQVALQYNGMEERVLAWK